MRPFARLPRRARRHSSLLALVLAAFAGCDDPSGPGDHALQVYASTQGAFVQSGATLQGAGPASVAAASGVTSIRVERILLVLGRVKLEKAAETANDFVEERSVVVALTPGGGPELALTAEVPAGHYKELELAFDKLERGNPREESLIQQHPALADRSVSIEGTLTGTGGNASFAFTADLDMDVEILFQAPREIGPTEADPMVASIVLSLDSWLRDSAGALLDPRDPASRSIIEGNIQRAIELHEGLEAAR
jgi:hypothetical protein